jgi:hypothetical protein
VSTFRDDIAVRCAAKSGLSPWNKADAVLAMPEMQAIRKALRHVASLHINPRSYLAAFGLPESVIAWVMDGGV